MPLTKEEKNLYIKVLIEHIENTKTEMVDGLTGKEFPVLDEAEQYYYEVRAEYFAGEEELKADLQFLGYIKRMKRSALVTSLIFGEGQISKEEFHNQIDYIMETIKVDYKDVL